MRIVIGLILIVAGLVAIGGGLFTGGFGDRDLWSVVMGGAAVFFGIGMLLRGAMRTAIWALAALIFVFGGGIAFFRSFV